jgi:hypothetical protein
MTDNYVYSTFAAPPQETSTERPTGLLRWNGPTLEQEFEVVRYINGLAARSELTWQPVPQVGPYTEPEPGEHAEVLAAIDACNTGEEE